MTRENWGSVDDNLQVAYSSIFSTRTVIGNKALIEFRRNIRYFRNALIPKRNIHVTMPYRCEIVSRLNHEVLVILPKKFKMYENVFDNSGRKIGKVVRILGPVAKPYGVVRLDSAELGEVQEMFTK